MDGVGTLFFGICGKIFVRVEWNVGYLSILLKSNTRLRYISVLLIAGLGPVLIARRWDAHEQEMGIAWGGEKRIPTSRYSVIGSTTAVEKV